MLRRRVNRGEAECTREVMKTTFSGYICAPGIGNEDRPCVTIRTDYIYERDFVSRRLRSDNFRSLESAAGVKRIAKFGKGLPNRRRDRNFRSRRMQFVIRYRSDPSPRLFSLSRTSSAAHPPPREKNALIFAITLVSLPPKFLVNEILGAGTSPTSYNFTA